LAFTTHRLPQAVPQVRRSSSCYRCCLRSRFLRCATWPRQGNLLVILADSVTSVYW